jgi:hypothetical protein
MRNFLFSVGAVALILIGGAIFDHVSQARVELVGPAFRTFIAGEHVVCSRIARGADHGFLCVQP